jgi:hypothetical protein
MRGDRHVVVAGEPLVTRPARTLLALALGAGLLALVLPTPTIQLGTGYLPGWCTTSYDLDGWATLNCTPGIVTSTVDVVHTTGLSTTARIFVAAAIVLVALAVRVGRRGGDRAGSRSVVLLRAALVAAALGAVVGGLGGPARVAMVAAAAFLALALRAWDTPARAVAGSSWPAPATGPGAVPTQV